MCGSVFSSVNHSVRFGVCSPGLPDISRVAAHRTFDGQSHRQSGRLRQIIFKIPRQIIPRQLLDRIAEGLESVGMPLC